MEIRKATNEDLSEIIKVLKASLGENELPLSEQIWNYKHHENPFGESIVLLAEENNNIAGVRAFMRWEWRVREKTYATFRAVDTATHPDYQGKGIFKNLTLSAVNEAEKAGDHFIFNTPNDQSRPGYIKMGWNEVSEVNVGLLPSLRFWNWSKKGKYQISISSSMAEREQLCHNWNEKLAREDKLFTPKSPQFLHWRYEKNPLQRYEVIGTEDFYLAGYLKRRKTAKEFRVAESIFINDKGRSQSKVAIKNMATKFGAQIISFAPPVKLSFSFTGAFGPILTLKKLNLSVDEEKDFLKMSNWCYSLGDLELF